MTTDINKNKNLPLILFKDYNGFWGSLNTLFWSQSSSMLVAKHPSSSLEEIISSYCPQCLTKHSEDEVNTYKSRCSSCMFCPCCEALLVAVTLRPDELILSCGWCLWKSSSVGIVAPTKEDLYLMVRKREREGYTKEAFNLVSTNLQKKENVDNSLFQIKSVESGGKSRKTVHWYLADVEDKSISNAVIVKADSIHRILDNRDPELLVKHLKAFELACQRPDKSKAISWVVDEEDNKVKRNSNSSSVSYVFTNINTIKLVLDEAMSYSDSESYLKSLIATVENRWTEDDLEKKLKNTPTSFVVTNDVTSDNVFTAKELKLSEAHLQTFSATKDINLTCVSQRIQNENYQPSLTSALMPSRIKLRSKRTIRCRSDLESGKMNILLQPKPYPLEGDSSSKVQKGKWWVKDASAIHEVPFISILKMPSKSDVLLGSYGELVLCITNPKEMEMIFTFHEQTVPFNPKQDNSYVYDIRKTVCNAKIVELKPAPIVSALDNNNYNNTIPIAIGPYEDELLREDDNDNVTITKSQFDNQVKVNGVMHPTWYYEMSQNVATVKIPVCKMTSELVKGVTDKNVCFDLILHATVTVKGAVKILAAKPKEIVLNDKKDENNDVVVSSDDNVNTIPNEIMNENNDNINDVAKDKPTEPVVEAKIPASTVTASSNIVLSKEREHLNYEVSFRVIF
eukprot:gene8304-11235_t